MKIWILSFICQWLQKYLVRLEKDPNIDTLDVLLTAETLFNLMYGQRFQNADLLSRSSWGRIL